MYKACPTCNDYIEGDLKNKTYSDPEMIHSLVNVTRKISIELIVYIVLNVFIVLCYALTLFFKGKRGPMYCFI